MKPATRPGERRRKPAAVRRLAVVRERPVEPKAPPYKAPPPRPPRLDSYERQELVRSRTPHHAHVGGGAAACGSRAVPLIFADPAGTVSCRRCIASRAFKAGDVQAPPARPTRPSPEPVGMRDPLSNLAVRWLERAESMRGGLAVVEWPAWQVLRSCAAELEQHLAVIRARGWL